ncbi:TPA: RNA methyltransferase [Candidatus Woesearchaeota archaeon]|nr:RNA methyltransferase [Candidatus Woesearchaeota archaeon]
MISIALVGPEIPGNVGAIARCMANFDFSDLVIVRPQCNYLSDEARNRAKYANRILKSATVLKDMQELRKKFDYIVGTTGRLGTDYNISRTPVLPHQLAEKVAALPKSKKVVIVFGRESNGMTNEELAMCDFITTIPTSERYSSLNLSHAVTIILYELSRSLTDAGQTGSTIGRFPMADRQDREQLIKMFNKALDTIDFPTPQKKETQQITWRRVLEKSLLTKRESRALMGFFSKVGRPKSKKR